MHIFDKNKQENEVNILLKDFANDAEITSWTINDIRDKRIDGIIILNSILKICCHNNNCERKLNFRITKDGIRLNCHRGCASFQFSEYSRLIQLDRNIAPMLCIYFDDTN
jgi:hypothetical protein